MKHPVLNFFLVVCILTACGRSSLAPSVKPDSGDLTPHSNHPCGDGTCDGPENPNNCPEDCPLTDRPKLPHEDQPPLGATSSQVQTMVATNPTSGAALRVIILPPQELENAPFPTLVLVPGGSGSSEDFTRPGRAITQRLNEAGYLVVLFDPDGRGESEGVEDNNGFTHQDGLAEVIRFAAAHPLSDGSGIGLVSYSFGITMCSGALARHPDLPVRFLIDWEGPADRNDTGSCDEAGVGHLGEVASCSDEQFWSEREAQTFIGEVAFPYLRLQSERDHVQPDVGHALRMVNAAVAGASSWVRLNELPINQIYDENAPPPLFAEDDPRSLDDMVLYYVPEMFSLH